MDTTTTPQAGAPQAGTPQAGTPQAGAPQAGEGLHTELSLVDAAAFSGGLIGPVGAIGLLGTGAALIIGRAVTLSFVFAVVGVALVAYCFIKLSQHISHTGSVYALVGVTLLRSGRGVHRQVVCGHPEPRGHDQSLRHLARGGQRRRADHVRAGARIMYAQARDATGKRTGLAGLSKHGQPGAALVVALLIIAANLIIEQLVGQSVLNATFSALQVGTVLILVAYVMATVGAIRFLFFQGKPKVPIWQVLIPILGGAFVCYTIYRNVFIGQTGALANCPYIEVAFLVVGLVVVLVAPGLSGRVRAGLAVGATP